jgi:hypothetical protein
MRGFRSSESGRGAALVVLALWALGCQSEATKRCHALLTSAQPVVAAVDAKSIQSVQATYEAVEAARAACAEAGRHDEHDQLLKAKNELLGHLEYLKKKEHARENARLTPAQLETLVKAGDPDCPKGQAYKHRESGKEIRCTGPQIVDLGWKQAEAYFSSRGFKIQTTTTPPTLRAEYGAELIVYTFDSVGSTEPARCVTLYPAPGIPWMEATARATGVQPRFLKQEGGTVRIKRGAVPLVVDERDDGLTVQVGECPPSSAAPASATASP